MIVLRPGTLVALLTALAASTPGIAMSARVVSPCGEITVCESGCDYAAVSDAVSAARDGDVIVVGAGTYRESIDVYQDLTIRGEDARTTIIDATGTGEPAVYFEGDTLALERLTITGGSGLSFEVYGQRMRAGGGISAWSGDVLLTECIVTGNQVERPPRATSLEWAMGGGIFQSSTGTVTLRRTVVTDNVAQHGGAVYLMSGGVIAENSTFSGNQAEEGGAIYTSTETETQLLSCTVADNSSEPGDTKSGGGIRHTGGTISAGNTIIAGNRPENCAFDEAGHLSSLGYNLSDSRECRLQAEGDFTNTDPLMLALADNGGQTNTHAITGESPATDAGDPNGCLGAKGQALDTDQRGFVRPVDGNGDGTNRCDIGAFESGSMAPPPTPTERPTATPSPSTEPTATELPTATLTPEATEFHAYLPVVLNSLSWSHLARANSATDD